MTTRGPTGAPTNEIRVIHFADEKLPRLVTRSMHLHMAFEAEIIVTLREKLSVHGAMRIMARGATFSNRLVLIHEWTRLLAMTFCALLIDARHRQATRWLHDFVPMRIVALHTIHPPFDHRMMLRQIEKRVHIQVTLKTRGRILPGINNKPAAAADLDMLAGWSMARFATRHVRKFDVVLIEFPMRARGKYAGDVRVTFHTRTVSDIMSAFDLWWRNDSVADTTARRREKSDGKGNGACDQQGLFTR